MQINWHSSDFQKNAALVAGAAAFGGDGSVAAGAGCLADD